MFLHLVWFKAWGITVIVTVTTPHLKSRAVHIAACCSVCVLGLGVAWLFVLFWCGVVWCGVVWFGFERLLYGCSIHD
jgi:hypothetical protein